ncbi:Hypothetical predicted protein [Cloeon dipterum]|uniref:Uncharacterized protein n=1 Tax=Cloeon dipterum TaxID=197152 RepID=A0A8S1DXM7_9INSE|nr:Hypothetical predicted protein [Cloeon dipterum]
MELERVLTLLKFCSLRFPTTETPGFLMRFYETSFTTSFNFFYFLIIAKILQNAPFVQNVTVAIVCLIILCNVFLLRSFFACKANVISQLVAEFQEQHDFQHEYLRYEMQQMKKGALRLINNAYLFLLFFTLVSPTSPSLMISSGIKGHITSGCNEREEFLISKLLTEHPWWPPTLEPTSKVGKFLLNAWTIKCIVLTDLTEVVAVLFLSSIMILVAKRARFLRKTASVALDPILNSFNLDDCDKWIATYESYIGSVNLVKDIIRPIMPLNHYCCLLRLFFSLNMIVYYRSHLFFFICSHLMLLFSCLVVIVLCCQLMLNECNRLYEKINKVTTQAITSAKGAVRHNLVVLNKTNSRGNFKGTFFATKNFMVKQVVLAGLITLATQHVLRFSTATERFTLLTIKRIFKI